MQCQHTLSPGVVGPLYASYHDSCGAVALERRSAWKFPRKRALWHTGVAGLGLSRDQPGPIPGRAMRCSGVWR